MAASTRCARHVATLTGSRKLSEPLKWQPSDDELDELARSLPPLEPEAARLEHNREALLAASQNVSQRSGHSRARTVVALAVPLAAAAAVVLWLARDTESPPTTQMSTPRTQVATQQQTPPAPTVTARVLITPRADARFEDSGDSSDRVVSLRDGEIMVEVSNLATDQRFRTRTSDTEIETFHAKFSAAASESKLRAVVVYEGRLQLRAGDENAVTLEAGDRWTARDKTAAIVAPQPPVEREPTTTRTPTAKPPTAKRPTPKVTPAGPENTAKTATPAAPGEREFRAGWASMRAAKPSAATRSFDAACKKATGSAIAEDACFWAGVAAKRAGKSATARRYLLRFLRRYPRSSRAGEASALAGWLLYDAGKLDEAEKRFRKAVRDRVPKVKRSAQKGLDAIAARRKSVQQ